MKTVFDSQYRAALMERVAGLKADSPRRWGTMNAAQMLCHLTDAMQMALGEKTAKPQGNLLTHTLGKWLFLYVLPWPKNLPTAPELLSTPPDVWQADLSNFKQQLEKFVANGENGRWFPHPIFGPLSGKEHGYLLAIHIDFHLKQFGV